MTKIDFKGRIAIVTGAGNGLGRQYALELAARGASVLVNDLGVDQHGTAVGQKSADAVTAEIRAAGGHAVANYDSVATREGGEAIVKAALDHFGRVDILINNAGILRNRRFADMSDTEIDGVLDTHLRAAFYVTQPAFRVMCERGYGRILFTTSGIAIYGEPTQANYAAAKSGVIGLMNTVAKEGRRHGVLSNAILPVAITRLATAMGDEHDQDVGLTDFSAVLPTCTPKFISPLALYLVSETCTRNREMYSALSGRYARVFIGLGDGWMGPRKAPVSLEDVAAHFDEIASIERFAVPDSLGEEVDRVSVRIRASG